MLYSSAHNIGPSLVTGPVDGPAIFSGVRNSAVAVASQRCQVKGSEDVDLGRPTSCSWASHETAFYRLFVHTCVWALAGLCYRLMMPAHVSVKIFSEIL